MIPTRFAPPRRRTLLRLLPMVLLACGTDPGLAAPPHSPREAQASEPKPQPQGAKSDQAATIRKVIESRYPGTHVADVQPSAIPGVYEVFTGDQIVYSDASADHVLMGPMVDTRTRHNLTEERLNDRGRIDFGTLPFNRAIKVVKGNGSHAFAVFSDPDCPYCQRLEKALEAVTDTTEYVFLFPIGSLHPQAPAKAIAIWCAKDRAHAWQQWMHEKKLPPAGTCHDDPVKELAALGEKLNINSTPTIFFADGRRVAGAISTQEIENLLAETSHPAAAASSAPKSK